jgi:hypothetical protein
LSGELTVRFAVPHFLCEVAIGWNRSSTECLSYKAQNSAAERGDGPMKIKSKVKAGGLAAFNHSQTRAIRVKSGVKVGGLSAFNHNQN